MITESKILETEVELEELVKSVRVAAVIGMKDEEGATEPAYLIPKRVQEVGIRVIPVNPKIAASLGEKAYPSLSAVTDTFDLVNVFRKSEAVGPIADEILALPPAKRPKAVWLQTGIVNDDAAKKLVAAGINVVMDRCLAVYTSRYKRNFYR